MTGQNNNIKPKHEIHEQIFSSIVALPVNEFISVIQFLRRKLKCKMLEFKEQKIVPRKYISDSKQIYFEFE